jgi:DNA (cytosine-5)-methyltransferase 1
MAEACRDLGIQVDLLAINHWQIAIDTHTASHPWARHMCAAVDHINPRDVVPGGRLQILCASPECTNHSIARGGRPINDQSRATAWHILKWAQELYIDNILIENVREFREWGPIGANGKPLKSRKGETFRAFLEALKSLGYRVDHRILNAADYGDPTTRERLFIIARRGNKEIHWPTPTHSRKGGKDLFGTTKPYRAAREIIDWEVPNPSIFTRKKPLAPTTMARIIAGLQKFNPQLEPFIVTLRGGMKNLASPRSVDEPVGTVSAQGTHLGLCEPFMVNMKGKSTARDIDAPVATQTTQIHQYLCEPFVLGQQSGAAPRSTDDPLPTVATAGAISMIEPFIVQAGGPEGKGRNPQSVSDPLSTVMTQNHAAIVEPFIITANHGDEGEASRDRRAHSVDDPLKTVTTENSFALVESFVLPLNRAKDQPRGVSDPLRTVTATSCDMGLVEPFIVTPTHGDKGGKSDASGRSYSIDNPLGVVVTENRFALAEPVLVKVTHGKDSDGRPHTLDEPLPTLTTKNGIGMAEAFIVQSDQTGSKSDCVKSLDQPLGTLVTKANMCLAEPYITKYYGTALANGVDEPLDTVTTKDRFGLVQPEFNGYRLDIRFRMLQPHELARAQGFPDDYKFQGTKSDMVKQIGNAVPVGLAKSLITSLLEDYKPKEKVRTPPILLTRAVAVGEVRA